MNRPRALAAALCLLAPLVIVGCGDDGDDASDTTPSAVVDDMPAISDAWARASADGQANGAAYMTITGGDRDDRLIGAAVSPEVAARAEVHETVMADDGDTDMANGGTGSSGTGMSGTGMSGMGGTMTMREVDAIDIPAGEDVALEPGGYHVMLMELVEPLVAGDQFDLTLTFEQAGDVTVTLEVRES